MKEEMKEKFALITSEEALRILTILHIEATTWSRIDMQRRLNSLGDRSYEYLLHEYDRQCEKPKQHRNVKLKKLLTKVMDCLDERRFVYVTQI